MVEVLERRVSDDCGCPEEDIVCHGLFMTIHHEPDGTGHIIVDWGENGEEDFFTDAVESIEELELEAYRIALEIVNTRPMAEFYPTLTNEKTE